VSYTIFHGRWSSESSYCPDEQFAIFGQQYDDLVEEGAKVLNTLPDSFGRDELRKMLNRLRDYKQNYLLFIKNYDAPFTNNLAERDLRPCKTKQKVSGCFRSWEGLSNFAQIRSLISTAKKRSNNLLDAISALFANNFLSPLNCNCHLFN